MSPRQGSLHSPRLRKPFARDRKTHTCARTTTQAHPPGYVHAPDMGDTGTLYHNGTSFGKPSPAEKEKLNAIIDPPATLP